MNKIIATLALGLVTFGLQAQNFTARDFLGGNTAVLVTNNTSVAYGEVNVIMTNYAGKTVYSLTNRYSTNSILVPGTPFTNNYVYNGPAWQDVLSFSNRDGDPASASIAYSVIGSTAQSTNTLTLTFTPLIAMPTPQVPAVPTSDAIHDLVLAVTLTGTTVVTSITNLSSDQMTGVAGWRLLSASMANNGAAGAAILQRITLNGYAP